MRKRVNKERYSVIALTIHLCKGAVAETWSRGTNHMGITSVTVPSGKVTEGQKRVNRRVTKKKNWWNKF